MIQTLFISIITLLQHPDLYHEKKVRIIGFVAMEFEHHAIYVSVEDYNHAITKNAIWLEVNVNDEIKKFNKQYVLIEGVFDKTKKGHLKLYSGTITNIDRIE